VANLQHIVNRVRNIYQFPYATLDDDIRAFANLACTRIASDVPKVWLLQSHYTFNTVVGTYIYALPPDYGSDKDCYLIDDGATYQLPMVSKEDYLRHVRAHRDTTNNTGQPSTYTVWLEEKKLELDPIPDEIYEIDMLYFAEPTELTAMTDTNVFTGNQLTLNMIVNTVLAELYEGEEKIDLAMIRRNMYREDIIRLRTQNVQRVRGQKVVPVKPYGYARGRLRERGR